MKFVHLPLPPSWATIFFHLKGFFTYNTEKQLQKSNYVLRDYFIISVARGAASTLSAEFTATVSPKISGETPYVDLEIGGDLTLQIGVERKFTGPPEFPNNPNNYNSREYRVKFSGTLTSGLRHEMIAVAMFSEREQAPLRSRRII